MQLHENYDIFANHRSMVWISWNVDLSFLLNMFTFVYLNTAVLYYAYHIIWNDLGAENQIKFDILVFRGIEWMMLCYSMYLLQCNVLLIFAFLYFSIVSVTFFVESLQ